MQPSKAFPFTPLFSTLLACLLFAGCSILPFGHHAKQDQPAQPGEAATTGTATAAETGIPLRPGDIIEVRVANIPSEDIAQLSALYTLDESGMINIPFIGLVKAGGLAPSQVQVVIQQKLVATGVYSTPTVMVNPPSGGRLITVSGAVKAPGRIPYTSDLTLMSSIDAAGGPSDFAGDGIRLVRNGKIQKFSRKKLHNDPSLDLPVKPGDRIEVVESAW